jgi:hypothetical protein
MSRLCVSLMLCAACGATPRASPRLDVSPREARPALVPVGHLGDVGGRPLTTVPLNHYELAREPTPTQLTLRAVLLGGDGAFAFGDDGTILKRGGPDGWTLVPSPTHERLRGVSKSGRVFVVGDHGTWLAGGHGTWAPEVSGTDEDLYAIIDVDRRSFAVGAHGVLIERSSDGHFSRVETRTRATLRAILYSHAGSTANRGELMDDLYIVGDGGTVVDCSLRMDPPICIPRSSPTEENLVAVVDAIPSIATFRNAHARPLAAFVLGGEGATLGTTLERVPPYEFGRLALRVPVGMAAVVATRAPFSDDGAVLVGTEKVFPPMIVVGAGGRGAFLDGTSVKEFSLPGVGGLQDVTAAGLDVLAVGEGGAIVHGWMPGALQKVPIEAELY